MHRPLPSRRSRIVCSIVMSSLLSSALVVYACGSQGSPPAAEPGIQVRVDGDGYHPARVTAERGKAVTLVFTRTTDQTCGQVLVFPELGIRRDLPLNVPVKVSVTPSASEIRFTCGMDMYRGAVVGQ